MTETIGNALEVRDHGPAAMVETYRAEYAALVPTHVNADQWIRLAVGVIRGDENLEKAARNDIGVFLRELKTAARLGLEPGTEQFYLTPRKSKAHGGRPIIKGIVGYQGIVELIYRAGAVSSVVVEVVRAADTFTYTPGRDERPIHEIDWFGGGRGDLVGVYAYAVMKDSATSKVVVLNRQQVMEAKAKSDGANGRYPQYSPWATNEESMWLKTAARRLAKWVPTSAEYMREQLRAQAEVATETQRPTLGGDATAPMPSADIPDEGDDLDEGPIDAEFVDETGEVGS
ncbi:recombinase RecT [Streptomyces sp. Isolate_219]|uniref:recombinase RecT n=1 Tax=Streptomyces sp. Isolate_219 TaxID=2950110 RepID=UPI0021C9B4B9|nr:recombinase RecT [Streptomyces sp. Isolate_219]MCR8574729.1 recombinase RecT [Streptomyces sp. Isolate_219]